MCRSFHSSTSPQSLSELNVRAKHQDRHGTGMMLFCLSGKIFLQVYAGVLLLPIEAKGKIGPTPESDGHSLKFQCKRNAGLNCNEGRKWYSKKKVLCTIIYSDAIPEWRERRNKKEKSATQYYLL